MAEVTKGKQGWYITDWLIKEIEQYLKIKDFSIIYDDDKKSNENENN